MFKIIKRLIYVSLVAIIIAITFAGCSNEEQLKNQISELQQDYSEIYEQIYVYQNQLQLLEDQFNGYEDTINELQHKIVHMMAQIENLSGTPVSYTAKAPVYAARDGDIEYANFDHHEDYNVSFEGFYNYCKYNFSDYEFYLLAPIVDEYDFHPNRYRNYTVFAESVENDVVVNPMFYERMMMYSDILGDGNYVSSDSDGYVPWSIDLEIYSMPVENLYQYNDYSLNFQFGYTEVKGDSVEYVNVSLGSNCFATCFYKTNAYVSEWWLRQYFDYYLREV